MKSLQLPEDKKVRISNSLPDLAHVESVSPTEDLILPKSKPVHQKRENTGHYFQSLFRLNSKRSTTEMNEGEHNVTLYHVSKSSATTYTEISGQQSWNSRHNTQESKTPQVEWSYSERRRKNSTFSFIDERRKSKIFNLSLLVLLVTGVGFVISFLLSNNISHLYGYSGSDGLSFNKGPVVNCTPLAKNEFPPDLFSQSERRSGALFLHFALVAYTFLALAIVCDDFFVPALEAISDRLKLNPDVAGATLMAIGSSTPELFTSVAGVFIAESDIGVGTIVGSAVFNIVFIISLCALLIDAPVTLAWYPVIRDSSFYLLSIVALVCIMLDHYIFWYEALLMLVLYGLYILLMYINEWVAVHVDSFFRRCCPRFCCPKSGYEDLSKEDSSRNSTQGSKVSLLPLLSCQPGSSSNDGGQEDDITSAEKTKLLGPKFLSLQDSLKASLQASQSQADKNIQIKGINCDVETVRDELLVSEQESPLKYPSGSSVSYKCLWVISFPIYLALTFTVPDCRKYDNKLPVVIVSFWFSIFWIAIFSYIMVWMVTMIGFTLSIPDTIMGLTFLAAGTSVPDAMASVIVARNGEADMAVSNSIGSNIFDILFCLGLPWLIKAVKEPVAINSGGVIYIGFTVMTTVLVIVAIMALNKWRLNKKLGVFLLTLYLVFVVYASLVETNVFGYVNPPPCKA